MKMMMTLFKSKTLMFALALAVLGVIEMNVKLFSAYMSPEFFGIFSITISIIVAILRVFTTLPLSEK